MVKRAVLYARVSGDDRSKDGRNLRGQIEICRKYALDEGYTIVDELAEDDRGASGALFDLPQLNQALTMAKSSEFDILVVRELDRFARSLAKQLIVENEFRRAGVEIVYVLGEYPDTPEGNLNKNIKAVIAEYERLKINERMTRGRRLKIKDKHVLLGKTRAPYGYRVVEKNGKRTLEIDEEEARIIKLIFSWYTDGDGEREKLTMGQIAGRLTELGVPTASDTSRRRGGSKKKRGYGEWGRATVQRILKNETYSGTWKYGKYAKQENGKWGPNPKENILTVKVPAIIEKTTWDEACKLRDANKRYARRKHNYLASGVITCGLCGHKAAGTVVNAHGKKYLYYRCGAASGSKHDIVEKCSLPLFPAGWIDENVWALLRYYVLNPEELNEGLDDLQNQQEEITAPLKERLASIDSLLAESRNKLDKLLDLYLSGEFDKSMLVDRKDRLEKTIESLEKEYSLFAETIEVKTITEEQKLGIQEFAADVALGLDVADEDFATKRRLVELLDVAVTLTVEDGEKVAYLRCSLSAPAQSGLPTPALRVSSHNTTSHDAL